MGVVLKENIMKKLYAEFDVVERSLINKVIKLGDKRLLNSLNKDEDVMLNNGKSFFIFVPLMYGMLSNLKKRIQNSKRNNRKRVSKFLNKEENNE